MKVLHVSPAFFGPGGYTGGGERYAYELARAVAQECPGTRLVSFASEPREYSDGPLQVRVYRPDGHVDGNFLNPVGGEFVADVLTADVVHCHHCNTFFTNMLVLFAKAAGKVVVLSDLGGGTRHYSKDIRQNDLVDGLFLISEFSANAFRAWRKKVTVIYGGVSKGVVAERPARTRRGVLYVGRLLPHKGVDYLIEAMNGDLSLELIGRPLDETFFTKLLRLSMGKQVTFNIEAEDGALARAYAGAVVAVLPSVYQDSSGHLAENAELLGLTVLEAMANATPVVVTRVASLPELLVEGEHGFVVPPNDPGALRERILYLSENPRVARRMGEAGRAHVQEKFTWPRVAQTCVKRYRELLDARR